MCCSTVSTTISRIGDFSRSKQLNLQADGGAIVRFRASGMLELAWHLFSWGNKIEIISPVSLRERMATELKVALAQHEGAPRYSLVVPEKSGP